MTYTINNGHGKCESESLPHPASSCQSSTTHAAREKAVMVDELNADIDLLNASIISLGEDRVLPSF